MNIYVVLRKCSIKKMRWFSVFILLWASCQSQRLFSFGPNANDTLITSFGSSRYIQLTDGFQPIHFFDRTYNAIQVNIERILG